MGRGARTAAASVVAAVVALAVVGCGSHKAARPSGLAAAGGATYYVDAATGSDANSGTSAGSPWKTLAKANAAVRPGATVVLSGTFTKQVLFPSYSGTATAPITYTAAAGGAMLDQPGLIGTIPYEVYLGARNYITVTGITFENTNYVNAPVQNKGVVVRSSNHDVFDGDTFDHMQMQLIGSDDNQIINGTWAYFVASYLDPATGQPDPNHPRTSGDMLNILSGSDRNLVQYNDMRYAGHSLIEIGNGVGASDVNADNQILDDYLSNPWYKDLILSDEGQGTVADRLQLLDANSVPTLYSTIAGQVDELQTSSDAVQFSGRDFKLLNSIIANCVGTYGCVTLGSRWYVDSNHPNGVLVESVNNEIAGNVVTGNFAAAAVSLVVFLSQADLNAGRTAVPALTGNLIHDNVFSSNAGTPESWNGTLTYSSFLYHTATQAPFWVGYNGNQVYGNQLDGGNANLNDGQYGTRYLHTLQTLAQFESASHGDVHGNS